MRTLTLLMLMLASCGATNVLPTGMLDDFAPNYPFGLWDVTLDGEPFLFHAPLLLRAGCVYIMKPGHEFLLGCGQITVVPHGR